MTLWHQLVNPSAPYFGRTWAQHTPTVPPNGVWVRTIRPTPDADPSYSIDIVVVNGREIERIPCYSSQERTRVFDVAAAALRNPTAALRNHYERISATQGRFNQPQGHARTRRS